MEMDYNSDGDVDAYELRKNWLAKGIVSEHELSSFFIEVDTNIDALISLDEYMKYIMATFSKIRVPKNPE